MERISRVGEYMGMGRYISQLSWSRSKLFTHPLDTLQYNKWSEMVMKMCISEGVTMIQCRWKCYDLIFGFSVLNYPRIHSSLILLSLRLAELGSLEAFHYSNNNSKEISCSVCCTFSSSFSLFLSLSLSLCFSLSILPSFPSLSLSIGPYHKLAAGAKFWGLFLLSYQFLVVL